LFSQIDNSKKENCFVFFYPELDSVINIRMKEKSKEKEKIKNLVSNNLQNPQPQPQ